jgi:hypothetical protein
MSMSKKDYELIAGVFAEHVAGWGGCYPPEVTSAQVSAIGTVVAALSRELEKENPRFNRVRFVDACGFMAIGSGAK